jgi:hypothetical protein
LNPALLFGSLPTLLETAYRSSKSQAIHQGRLHKRFKKYTSFLLGDIFDAYSILVTQAYAASSQPFFCKLRQHAATAVHFVLAFWIARSPGQCQN